MVSNNDPQVHLKFTKIRIWIDALSKGKKKGGTCLIIHYVPRSNND